LELPTKAPEAKVGAGRRKKINEVGKTLEK